MGLETGSTPRQRPLMRLKRLYGDHFKFDLIIENTSVYNYLNHSLQPGLHAFLKTGSLLGSPGAGSVRMRPSCASPQRDSAARRGSVASASWLGHAKYAVRRGSELPENANFF
jgi:hypothetical protein